MDSEELDKLYRSAFARGDFQEAAEMLNGFNEDDIHLRLSELGAEDTQSIHQGALENPRVGSQSTVARLTRIDRVPDADEMGMIAAGSTFRIRVLDSISVGEVVGISTGLFVVWDTVNKHRALYRYFGLMFTAGVPVSDGGAGDWSDPFSTARPVQINELGCVASLGQASIAVVGGWLLSLPDFAASVVVPTFFSKSFGIETGTGAFSFVPNSVEAFDGP